jgi:hypothetical protein
MYHRPARANQTNRQAYLQQLLASGAGVSFFVRGALLTDHENLLLVGLLFVVSAFCGFFTVASVSIGTHPSH